LDKLIGALRAKIKEEERLEEEERILQELEQKQKKLHRDEIDQSVYRMYQVAEKNHWNFLKNKTKQDQLLIQKEEKECTFHPQIKMSKATKARIILQDDDVHTRLFSQANNNSKKTKKKEEEKKILTSQALEEFILRQEIDQAYRSLQKFQLDQKYRYPFRPTLSIGTQRLINTQSKSIERRRRRRRTHCTTTGTTTTITAAIAKTNQQEESESIPIVLKEQVEKILPPFENQQSLSIHHSSFPLPKGNLLQHPERDTPDTPDSPDSSNRSSRSSCSSPDGSEDENQQESRQRRLPRSHQLTKNNNNTTSLVDKLLLQQSTKSYVVTESTQSNKSFLPLRNFEELLQALALEEKRLLSK
jgi:hypothetical protein